MKKIMFNDKYGLTQAVLDGRKTMTRRVIPQKLIDAYYDYEDAYCSINFGGVSAYSMTEFLCGYSRHQVGEVVAIAQSYNQIGLSPSMYCEVPNEYGGTRDGSFDELAGWENKMFVKADLMPHHIKITNIRVEHLQDISDDDCMKEGIYKHDPVHIVGYNHNFIAYSYDATEDPHLKKWWFPTPREAFQKLIDKVSGVGTWNSNPMVWVYEFELVD